MTRGFYTEEQWWRILETAPPDSDAAIVEERVAAAAAAWRNQHGRTGADDAPGARRDQLDKAAKHLRAFLGTEIGPISAGPVVNELGGAKALEDAYDQVEKLCTAFENAAAVADKKVDTRGRSKSELRNSVERLARVWEELTGDPPGYSWDEGGGVFRGPFIDFAFECLAPLELRNSGNAALHKNLKRRIGEHLKIVRRGIPPNR